MNTARWYAFGFFFTTVHYWSAWITIGALLIHVGAQLAVVRSAIRPRPIPAPDPVPAPDPIPAPDPVPAPYPVPAPDPVPAPYPVPASDGGGLSRRGLLAGVGAAAGVITVATVGQTVSPLAGLSVLAPRRPGVGPQRLPVNRTASGAGVARVALDPGYRLILAGRHPLALSLDALTRRPQHTVSLPITCVEGWSAGATWTGVRIRDLLDEAGFDPRGAVRVMSLQQRGDYRSSLVFPNHHRDPLTLLALVLNGEPLDPDHGYPCRLIAPDRPGVQQTKWVTRLEPAE